MDGLSYERKLGEYYEFNQEWYCISHSLIWIKLVGLSAILRSSWNPLWSIRIGLSKSYTAATEIIWGQFYSDRISWNETNKMFLHLTTYISSYNHVWELFGKLDLKYSSWKRFEYLSFYFDFIVFWHVLKGFYKIAGESI